MTLLTYKAYEIFAPANNDGSPRTPSLQQQQVWGTEIEAIAGAAATNAIIFDTRANLFSSLGYAANALAWVIADATAAYNGIYRKSGASGSGSWSRVADLPYSLINATNASAGTANAIVATTAIPVSESALVTVNVTTTNTASPVTIAFNSGSALTIKTVSGGNVAVGSLVSGMVLLGRVTGSTFRLFNDEAISALIYQARDDAQTAQAAAEIAEAAAKAARDIAAGYASDAVSQGNVPIYGTVAGLPALNVPIGMNAIRLNGFNSVGDGGTWLAIEIDNTGPLLAGQQLSNSSTRRWELTQAQTGPVPATALGAFTGTAVQDACNYMYRKGGGEVYLPSGTFNSITESVSIPAKVKTKGGLGSKLTAAETVTAIFQFDASQSAVEGVAFENVGGLATHAIQVDKPADNLPITVSGCFFGGFTEAVRWNDGDNLQLFGNTSLNCDIFLNSTNDCRNSNIFYNTVQGGAGIRFNKTTQGPEGVAIIANKILPAVDDAYCVRFDAGLEMLVFGNIFDQITKGSAVVVDASSHGDGSVSKLKLVSNWLGRNGDSPEANYGLLATGPFRKIWSLFNTYVGWQEAAVEIIGPCIDFMSFGNEFYHGDRSTRDINLTNASRVMISHDQFSGMASIVENGGVDGRVDMCTWADGAPLPATISEGLKYGRQAAGMTLLNRQEVVMTTAGTAIVFTHGMSYTPSIYHFKTVKGGANNSHLSIHDIDAINATLAVNVAPPSNFSIGLECNMER